MGAVVPDEGDDLPGDVGSPGDVRAPDEGVRAVSAVPGQRAGVGPADESELRLVAALRNGDEASFARLVDTLSPALLRVAQGYVPSRAVAEEVVQDTWLALLEGLDRFEGRSTLKTWLFRVLVNIAKTKGAREKRTTPFSALPAVRFDQDTDAGPTVDPSRFLPPDAPRWPGHWSQPPQSWSESPERQLVSGETVGLATAAIRRLPERQRVVVTLRDVEGFSAEEVCELLDVSAGNQRVLLHRGRARVRQALDDYLLGSG